jgi:hypothetical protein
LIDSSFSLDGNLFTHSVFEGANSTLLRVGDEFEEFAGWRPEVDRGGFFKRLADI